MTDHDDQMLLLPTVDAVASVHAFLENAPLANSGQRQPIGGTPPYTYSASPAGIVVVDNATGLVVAHAVGRATVTARDSAVPAPATASYEVNATAPVPVIAAPIPVWISPYETTINAATLPADMVVVQHIPMYLGHAAGHTMCLETKYRSLSDQVERTVTSNDRVAIKPGGNEGAISGAALKQTHTTFGTCAMTSRVRLYFSSATPTSAPDLIGDWSQTSILTTW